MREAVKKYTDYKDSGVPWLGEVPAHWQVIPNRALFREVNERNRPGEPLLSVTIGRGIIPQEVLLSGSSKKDGSNLDKSNYKLVKPGDIAYNKMRAWQGAIGVSEHRGIVSPAYVIVRPRGEQVPRYYHYLFRTPGFVKEAERWSYGITSDMWSLRYEDFKRIYNVLPPVEEQRAIARFLDQYDRLTRRYIRAQRRLIALLEEQKQALIQRAVTRGLDPGVRLKPSGADWLDAIPDHWEVMRLKYVARTNPSKSESSRIYDQGARVCFLPMENVSEEGVVDYSHREPISELWQGYTYFRRRDVVLAKITPCFENGKGACLDEMPTDIGFGTTEFIVLRSLGQVLPRYLYYFTRCPRFRQLGVDAMTGAAGQQRVSVEFVRNFAVPIPPLREQAAIITYLSEMFKDFQRSIDKTQRQIDLVREYRTRLIADVVTGKLDVRDVALPELAGGDDDESHYDEDEPTEVDDLPELEEEADDEA